MNYTRSLLILTLLFLTLATYGQKISPNLDLLDTTQLHMLQTLRGDILLGRVDGITQDSVYFRVSSRFPVTYGKKEITWLGPASEAPRTTSRKNGGLSVPVYSMANGSENLLYSPTAFRLGNREVEFRNVDLLYNEASTGIGEHVQLGGGIVLPAAFFVKTKVAFDLSELFHLGAGVHAVLPILEDTEGIGFHFFGIATLGYPDRFLNITAGYAFTTDFFEPEFLITVGGGINFSPNWRVSMDTGFVPGEGAISSLLVGWFNERNRFEFGPAFALDGFIPLPVLSYSRRF